jgi:hypothetical protein
MLGFFMFYGQCNKAIEGSVEKRTVEVEFDPDMYHNIKKRTCEL